MKNVDRARSDARIVEARSAMKMAFFLALVGLPVSAGCSADVSGPELEREPTVQNPATGVEEGKIETKATGGGSPCTGPTCGGWPGWIGPLPCTLPCKGGPNSGP
jgi:hypothetical protein